MTNRTWRTAAVVALALAVTSVQGHLSAAARGQQAVDARIDRIFGAWTGETPGCAVGVSSRGAVVLERAYGMADLEHAARNTPATIFEAGSVSKQFTAAAILLLARDGKLSLNDPARKYVPELPDYGTPITLTHLLQHTSGLRDWGEVAAISGWPRRTRVHTHAHVLDIVSRQRKLNFAPGADWSYSNSGYNLAAVIVSRVSGKPFAEFTRERIFAPLGMRHTSWRDDHTRVVRNRAIAYAGGPDRFRIDMPFEDVHGNGGLLTTVGDLLRWNENFVAPKVADAAFVAQQLQRGLFGDGRPHDYGYGVFIGTYKGVPEISHSGATAGYRAHLARYPGQRLSVAVLCNAGGANAAEYARQVAEIYLGEHLQAAPAPAAHHVPPGDLHAAAGLFRHVVTGETLTVIVDGATLRVQPGGPVIRAPSGRYLTTAGDQFEVTDGGRRIRVERRNGTRAMYERAEPITPSDDDLKHYVGVYTSEEAETTLTVRVERGVLVVRRRPDSTATLTPVYADAFRSPSGLVRFHRDSSGRIHELSVVTPRVWDLRFQRQPGSGTD